VTFVSPHRTLADTAMAAPQVESAAAHREPSVADYTLRIKESPIEVAPKRIISLTSNYRLFTAALKYNVGVVPNVFLNMEMNALGVL
jgi:hypothetical protein